MSLYWFFATDKMVILKVQAKILEELLQCGEFSKSEVQYKRPKVLAEY